MGLGEKFEWFIFKYVLARYDRREKLIAREYNRQILAFLLCGCLMVGLCGCGWVEEENTASGDMQALQVGGDGLPGQDTFKLLPEAELDYRVPEQHPGIWVSLGGYDSKGSKEVYFCGHSLPDTFRIMDASNGQCVYTGRLEENRYNADTEEYNSYGSSRTLWMWENIT